MRSHLRFALAIVAASQAPGALAFTAEQAAAGRAAYEQTCANCHGPTLRQLPNALLGGTEFVGRWGNRATSDLIAQARSTMPPDNPGGLPAETYANVVAYLLQANGGAASANAIDASTTARIGQGLTGQVAVAAAAGTSAPPAPTGVIVAGTVPQFTPVTDAMLRDPAAEDWLMLRHDYSATSYSPLTQITPDNARQLTLAWIWPMRDGGTNQPAPLVYDGTIYLANTGGIVQALDARTGNLIWEHHVGAEIAPRGIALYENMLIFQSAGEWAVRPQAARLIALDARTGETVWNVEMPDVYATNSGPIVANGLLIQGGGTCTVYEETKCSISAYDAATGEQRWLFRTIALDGEPGGDSWGGLPDLYRAGGESVDHRQLRSRSEPHVLGHRAGEAVDAREPRHGRRPTSRSTRARRSRSTRRPASSKWHYAHAPGETFDLDVVFERVLVDAGNEKWVLSVGKDGVLWKHDRATGEYLGHAETVFQNVWASFDPRDRQTALPARHSRAQSRRVDRRVPEHGRRQELARDELSRTDAPTDHSA